MRAFFAFAIWAFGMIAPLPALAQSAEFVTLGTGGGPRVQAERSQPANALIVGEDVYLFDVGEGTQRQLHMAGIDLRSVRVVILSHHHIDHVGGLMPLIAGRWLRGETEPLTIIGPPGTSEMVGGMLTALKAVERVPVSAGPTPVPIAETVRVEELPDRTAAPVGILQRPDVRVLAVTNTHFPNVPDGRSYSFRIEVGGVSAVLSGDTGPSESLARLAEGADLLFVEVMDLAAIEKSLQQDGLPPGVFQGVMRHLRSSHLTPENIGELASEAAVGAVVLTHLVPGVDTEPNNLGYLAGIAPAFSGPVSVANDLQRFKLTTLARKNPS